MSLRFLRGLKGLPSVRKRQHSGYSEAVKQGVLDLVFETLLIEGRLPHVQGVMELEKGILQTATLLIKNASCQEAIRSG